jgi:hypothetical protein
MPTSPKGGEKWGTQPWLMQNHPASRNLPIAQSFLFVAEGDHGIYFRSAACWDVAR